MEYVNEAIKVLSAVERCSHLNSRKVLLAFGTIALLYTTSKVSKLVKFLKAEPTGVELYVANHTDDEPALLRELREETWRLTRKTPMVAGAMQGRFLKMLVTLTNAKRVLEIGCFTGYSALCMAEALPADGKLITCDVSDEYTQIARKFWARAGPAGAKIELKLAPALDTIKTFREPFDLVFIDADKENYLNYYNAIFPLVKQGGLIVIDNVLLLNTTTSAFWRSIMSHSRSVHEFNEYVKKDSRVEKVMLPVRDGITLVRKVKN